MRKSILNRSLRRQRIGAIQLEMTSLMDVITILLVFLVQYYNTTGVELNIPEGVQPPISTSDSFNNPGVAVQVSPTKIWVDDKLVIDTEAAQTGPIFDSGGRRIIPIFNELVRKREDVQILNKRVPESKPFTGVVNFIMDKSLKYSYIRKLMHTAAEAGYLKYKFVVIGENQ
jgi:biopolymer transport protein ExbD